MIKMKKKEKEQNKQLLVELKNKNASSTIVDKKNITLSSTQKATESKQKKKTAKATKEQTKRDIKAYAVIALDKQSDYERRFYMRNYHAEEKQQVVRHKTSHSLQTMMSEMYKYLVQCFNKEKAVRQIKTSEICSATDSYGPSYTDVIRNSAKHLEKLKLVQIVNIAEQHSRCKYAYVLQENSLNSDFAKELLK